MSRLKLLDRLLYEKSLAENRKISQVRASREIGVSNSFFHQALTGLTRGTKNKDNIRLIAEYFGKTEMALVAEIERDTHDLG